MQNDQATQRRTILPGSDIYYALRFAPPGKQNAISALHGVVTEISEVVQKCSDAGVARLKLQWWHDELERTWQGDPQHPTTKNLHPYLSEYNLPVEYLQELVDGNVMDIDKFTYAGFSELALYCHRISGTTQALITEILGYSNHQTSRYATDLGIALKLIEIICNLQHSVQRGRSYIPRDELEKFQLTPESLLRREHTQQLTELLAHQSTRARERLVRARERLSNTDQPSQVFGLILAAIAAARLDEVETDDFRVLSQRIELTPVRKLWIAWRTARRHRRV